MAKVSSRPYSGGVVWLGTLHLGDGLNKRRRVGLGGGGELWSHDHSLGPDSLSPGRRVNNAEMVMVGHVGGERQHLTNDDTLQPSGITCQGSELRAGHAGLPQGRPWQRSDPTAHSVRQP